MDSSTVKISYSFMVVKLLAFVFFFSFPPMFKGPLRSLPRSGGGDASWQLQNILQRCSDLPSWTVSDRYLWRTPHQRLMPAFQICAQRSHRLMDMQRNYRLSSISQRLLFYRNGLNIFSFLYPKESEQDFPRVPCSSHWEEY